MLEDIIDQIFLNNGGRHDDKPAPTTMSSSAEQQQQPATCPVDHKSREAWLEKARAAGTSSQLPPSHPPIDASAGTSAESCPVDHSAREVWVQQARVAAATTAAAAEEATRVPPTPSQSPSSSSWSSYLPRIPFLSSSDTSSESPTATTRQPTTGTSRLGVDREVSTIPRTRTTSAIIPARTSDHALPAPAPAPANNEQETGADGATGNWIYPSERMFFEAMKRKGHDPRAADMRTVVPIHNAVNERAWAEIKGWEGPWIQRSSCDGPRLHSFSGLSTRMSPKARLNTLLGYQAPFDRHDWVVDRCGKEIEYVIDFYAGRAGASAAGTGVSADGKLSFYLDVRPKLNSWEGVKMRAFRAVGLA